MKPLLIIRLIDSLIHLQFQSCSGQQFCPWQWRMNARNIDPEFPSWHLLVAWESELIAAATSPFRRRNCLHSMRSEAIWHTEQVAWNTGWQQSLGHNSHCRWNTKWQLFYWPKTANERKYYFNHIKSYILIWVTLCTVQDSSISLYSIRK